MRRQVLPAFLGGERAFLVLAVGGVRGGVGTALVILQGQIAVRVRLYAGGGGAEQRLTSL